ncbi:hypothetical protein BDR22DRAFT_804600 [Usnea florida]
MHYSTLLLLCVLYYDCTALTAIFQPSNRNPIRGGYVFPKGAWNENLAIRSNGQQLLTRLDTPEIWLLELETWNPYPAVLVYRFPGVQAVTGIAELAPDVFAVIAGNYTLDSGPTPGSWAIWRMDLNGWDGTPTELDDTPPLPADHYVLMSDFRAGVVYRLDVNSGAYKVVIEDSLMVAVPQPIFGVSGVNGLRVRDGYLYFTNTGQNILAKIPINADGTPSGTSSVIAHTPASTDYFDGFTFDSHGTVYIGTGSGNTLVKVSQSGGPVMKVAGQFNSLSLAEPTNCAFGRGTTDQGVLYVATAGGIAAPVQGRLTRGGSLMALDL